MDGTGLSEDDRRIARNLLNGLAAAIVRFECLAALLSGESDQHAHALAELRTSGIPSFASLSYGLPEQSTASRFVLGVEALDETSLFMICMYGTRDQPRSLAVTLTTSGELTDWAAGAGVSLSVQREICNEQDEPNVGLGDLKQATVAVSSSRDLISGPCLEVLKPIVESKSSSRVTAVEIYPEAVVIDYLVGRAYEVTSQADAESLAPRLRSCEGPELTCIRNVRRGLDPVVGRATFVPALPRSSRTISIILGPVEDWSVVALERSEAT